MVILTYRGSKRLPGWHRLEVQKLFGKEPHRRGPFFKRASLRAEGRCEDLAGLPPRLYEFPTLSLLAMGVGDMRNVEEFHRLHC